VETLDLQVPLVSLVLKDQLVLLVLMVYLALTDQVVHGVNQVLLGSADQTAAQATKVHQDLWVPLGL